MDRGRSCDFQLNVSNVNPILTVVQFQQRKWVFTCLKLTICERGMAPGEATATLQPVICLQPHIFARNLVLKADPWLGAGMGVMECVGVGVREVGSV